MSDFDPNDPNTLSGTQYNNWCNAGRPSLNDSSYIYQVLNHPESTSTSSTNSGGSSVGGGGCFSGSTKIMTPNGNLRIDQLKVGQIILSWNAATKELVERPINKVIFYKPSNVIEMRLDGLDKPIIVTPSHTCLTSAGWEVIKKLKPADKMMVLSKGKPIETAIRSLIMKKEKEPVFNLHTKGEHTFIADGLIAHNFTHLRALRTLAHQISEQVYDASRRIFSPQVTLG